MIRRLRRQFIRIATLSVAAVMLLLTILLNTANLVSARQDLRRTLDMIHENEGTIPVQSAPADPSSAPAGVIPGPPAGHRHKGGPFTQETPFSTRYFVLYYQPNGTLNHADLSRIAAVTQDNVTEYLQTALSHGEGYGLYNSYYYAVFPQTDGSCMAIFLDCYQQVRTVRNVLLWSLLADFVCILLVFLLVVLFSGRAVEPVAKSTQRQKQFITDASHELKTPITVISTSLRVLEMEVGRQKWLSKAQAQTEKLTSLVNSLVALCRLDENEAPLHPEEFCISDAVSETADSFCDFAAERGHRLCTNITPGLTICGDQNAVRQLVSILLDNAVKYALPDSDITLSLEKARRGVRLVSFNACNALPAGEAEKLFDRFYRADPSRNSATGGFGIGLSMARSIAESHKGSIHAEYKNGCIYFTVFLHA